MLMKSGSLALKQYQFNQKWNQIHVILERLTANNPQLITTFKEKLFTPQEYMFVNTTLYELIHKENGFFITSLCNKFLDYTKKFLNAQDVCGKLKNPNSHIGKLKIVVDAQRVYQEYAQVLRKILHHLFNSQILHVKEKIPLLGQVNRQFASDVLVPNLAQLNSACIGCICEVKIFGKDYLTSILQYLRVIERYDSIQLELLLKKKLSNDLLSKTLEAYYPFVYETIKDYGLVQFSTTVGQVYTSEMELFSELGIQVPEGFTQKFAQVFFTTHLNRLSNLATFKDTLDHMKAFQLCGVNQLSGNSKILSKILPVYVEFINGKIDKVFGENQWVKTKKYQTPFINAQIKSEILFEKLMLFHSNIVDLNKGSAGSAMYFGFEYSKLLKDRLGTLKGVPIEHAIMAYWNSCMASNYSSESVSRTLRTLLSILRLIRVNVDTFHNSLCQSMLQRIESGRVNAQNQETMVYVVKNDGMLNHLDLYRIWAYHQQTLNTNPNPKDKKNTFQLVSEDVMALRIIKTTLFQKEVNLRLSLPSQMNMLYYTIRQHHNLECINEISMLHLVSQLELEYNVAGNRQCRIRVNNVQAALFYYVYNSESPVSIEDIRSHFQYTISTVLMGSLAYMVRAGVLRQTGDHIEVNYDIVSDKTIAVMTFFPAGQVAQELIERNVMSLRGAIVRKLKWCKELDFESVVQQFSTGNLVGERRREILETIDTLIDEGYIKRESQMLIYIP